MNKRKLILIIGRSGSGKSTLENELTKYDYRKLISTTTRPMRDADVQHEAYHFVTLEEFNNLKMFERVEFVGNWYGLSKDEFMIDNKNLIAVVEPNGAEQLIHECSNDFDVKVVFFDLVETVCYNNMTIKRGDSKESAKKRLISDDITERFRKTNIEPDLTIIKMTEIKYIAKIVNDL